MTFQNLQDRVMDRMKLSSTDARTRIKNHLNERYRAVATSCGLTSVRYGTVSLNTVDGTIDYDVTGIIHPISVLYPAGNRVVIPKTPEFFRGLDPGGEQEGDPKFWALLMSKAAVASIRLHPEPDAVYALSISGIVPGTDMSANGDVPVLPEDFHDVLIFGACADELVKLEKLPLADAMEQKYEKRLRELRYFVSRAAYLDMRQNDESNWWFGPWFYNYRP